MSLDRTLPLWLARQPILGGPDAISPVLEPALRWLGSSPTHVAGRLRSHFQAMLWQPGGEAVLDKLPDVDVQVVEPIALTLPPRRDGFPRVAVTVGVLVVSARSAAAGPGHPVPAGAPAAVLAVAPALGLSWAGTTPEAALDGLREAIRLDLLARDPPLHGAALAALAVAAAAPLTVEPLDLALKFPTFSEMRAYEKAGGAKAQHDLLGPVQGGECWHMEAELDALDRAIQAQRSVVLVGPRGVGKSALIRAYVRTRWAASVKRGRLLEAHAPMFLVKLMANGSWQDELARYCTHLGETGDWVYVTALPELFEVGRYEGNSTSCGEYVRPWLGRGELRLISECTAEEIATIDARYPGALNGVVRVPVPEPTDRLEAILEAWNTRRGGHFSTGALHEALRLHRRFAPCSGFPGRILRFLDAVRLEALRASGPGPLALDRDDVYASFCAQTGLLRALIDPRHPLPYATIEAFFASRVYGQPAAGAAVTAAIASVKADVSPWGKPLASMLLVGPTGVGKTETARALAEFLFGSADRMIRFDMSEYQTPGAVLRLIEGPDGEGLLTSAVRRQPFCVLLLDELEKAHSAVLDLLLQVLGEGRLTDGRGRLTDFCACVVLMTSNVGAVDARRSRAGFGGAGPGRTASEAALAEKAARYRDAVRSWLRPEMLNRIDHVLPFDPLGPDAIARVLDRELAALTARPGLRDVPLTVTPAARGHLEQAGYDPAWGARQLQRSIQDQLVGPIALAIYDGKEDAPAVRVDQQGGRLDVTVTRTPRAQGARRLDVIYDRLVGLRTSCRAVIEGPNFAELDARLEAEDRVSGHGGRRSGGRGRSPGDAPRADRGGEARESRGESGAERAVRAGLLALREELARAEQDVGVQALMDPEPPSAVESPRMQAHRAAYEALERRFRRLSQDLAMCTIPGIGALVVGVYGNVASGPLRELVAMYERVAVRCGQEVQVGRVFPAQGAAGKFTAVFPSGTIGPKPMPNVEPVGVELVVEGPAAGRLYAWENGVHAFSPGFLGPSGYAPPLVKELRVSVHTWPLPYAEFCKTRPEDLQRRLRFEGTPERTIGPERVQGARHLRLPDFTHLDQWLVRTFESRIHTDLTG